MYSCKVLRWHKILPLYEDITSLVSDGVFIREEASFTGQFDEYHQLTLMYGFTPRPLVISYHIKCMDSLSHRIHDSVLPVIPVNPHHTSSMTLCIMDSCWFRGRTGSIARTLRSFPDH